MTQTKTRSWNRWKYTPANEDKMLELYERWDVPRCLIGERFGLSKHVVQKLLCHARARRRQNQQQERTS